MHEHLTEFWLLGTYDDYGWEEVVPILSWCCDAPWKQWLSRETKPFPGEDSWSVIDTELLECTICGGVTMWDKMFMPKD